MTMYGPAQAVARIVHSQRALVGAPSSGSGTTCQPSKNLEYIIRWKVYVDRVYPTSFQYKRFRYRVDQHDIFRSNVSVAEAKHT